MRNETIINQVEPPESVDELLALARYGAKVEVAIKPRIYIKQTSEGRKHPSFRLCAEFSARIGGKAFRFEKTCSKGHETEPLKAAANGFVIANTRLYREIKRLQQAGVKCETDTFVLSELLPGTDLAVFEPIKPYYLDQFAILAGIGKKVEVSMATRTSRLEEKGGPVCELCALYTVYYNNEQYRIETFHGRFHEDADEKTIARIHEVALHRLNLEQRKLRRVGVKIKMDAAWRDEESFRYLHLAPAGMHPASGLHDSAVSLQSAQSK